MSRVRRLRPAFTLIEIMVVATVVGVVAAVAVPSLLDLNRAGRARTAVDEFRRVVGVLRDDARGLQVCLRATLPTAGATGGPESPLSLTVAEVPCPGETGSTTTTRTELLNPLVTSLQARQVLNGAPSTAVGELEFDREGALRPAAAVQFDLVVADTARRLRLYPVAGTLEELRP
jgi:prepilin-type N-terminal cleavage/methylation domain-containing protein